MYIFDLNYKKKQNSFIKTSAGFHKIMFQRFAECWRLMSTFKSLHSQGLMRSKPLTWSWSSTTSFPSIMGKCCLECNCETWMTELLHPVILASFTPAAVCKNSLVKRAKSSDPDNFQLCEICVQCRRVAEPSCCGLFMKQDFPSCFYLLKLTNRKFWSRFPLFCVYFGANWGISPVWRNGSFVLRP